MSNIYTKFVLFLLVFLITACAAPTVPPQPTPIVMPTAQIARYPSPDNYRGFNVYTEPPVYDPNSEDPFQMDLRSTNLKKLDLSRSRVDLLHALFDSKTLWPSVDKMPPDFDWQKIMELGKDPGLDMRALHSQGITGKGVNIAIIDQPLIIDHVEYPNRIRQYEEINVIPDTPSQMHGPAVASIAVGKTVGVAPDANLYYIATWMFDPVDSSRKLTYKYYAQALHRMIEINKELPQNQKIRAVSMSIGLHPTITGYDDFVSAIEAAKAAGIFPLPVSPDKIYGRSISGLGREPLSDPNNFQSYEPASWWAQDFYNKGFPTQTLLVPMDARTTASPTGKEDYVFYAQGGMSWTVPYLAGMYALAAQVKPSITPDEFWDTALRTGRTIQIQHDGKDYQFGIILDPQALIEALKDQ